MSAYSKLRWHVKLNALETEKSNSRGFQNDNTTTIKIC